MDFSKWYLDRVQYPDKIDLNQEMKTYTIGRSHGNQIICLSLYVSRKHCIIRRKDDNSLVIMDLASANGTYVNKIQIIANREIPLEEGDQIGLGVTDIINGECFIYNLMKIEVKSQPQLEPASVTSSSILIAENKNETEIIILSDSEEEVKVCCEKRAASSASVPSMSEFHKRDIPIQMIPKGVICKSEIVENEGVLNSINFEDTLDNKHVKEETDTPLPTLLSLKCKSEVANDSSANSTVNDVTFRNCLLTPISRDSNSASEFETALRLCSSRNDGEDTPCPSRINSTLEIHKKELVHFSKQSDIKPVSFSAIDNGPNTHGSETSLEADEKPVIMPFVVKLEKDSEQSSVHSTLCTSTPIKSGCSFPCLPMKTECDINFSNSNVATICASDFGHYDNLVGASVSVPRQCPSSSSEIGVESSSFAGNADGSFSLSVKPDHGSENQVSNKPVASDAFSDLIKSHVNQDVDKPDEQVLCNTSLLQTCNQETEPVTHQNVDGYRNTSYKTLLDHQVFLKLETMDDKCLQFSMDVADNTDSHKYTMEDDIIVISDDDLNECSVTTLEANDNNDDDKDEPVEVDEHDTESESDNEWWPKLSQSFLETIEREETEMASRRSSKRKEGTESDEDMFNPLRKKAKPISPYDDSISTNEEQCNTGATEIQASIRKTKLLHSSNDSRNSLNQNINDTDTNRNLCVDSNDAVVNATGEKSKGSRKILIIDAQPLIPRRRNRKPLDKAPEVEEDIGPKSVQKTGKDKRKVKSKSVKFKVSDKESSKPKHKVSTSGKLKQNSSLSSTDKKIITNIRKEKLKEIAKQSKQSSSSNGPNRPKVQIRVKNTKLSRGDILAEDLIPLHENIGEKEASSRKSKDVRTRNDPKPEGSSISSKHSTKKNKLEKNVHSEVVKLHASKESVNSEVLKLAGLEESIRTSIKDLPRIPRVKSTSVVQFQERTSEGEKSITCNDKLDKCLNNENKNGSVLNSKTQVDINIRSGVLGSVSSQESSAQKEVFDSVMQNSSAPEKGKQPRKRVRFKCDEELCHVVLIPVENFSALHPVVANVKDAPVNRNPSNCNRCDTQKNSNLEDAVRTVCYWNIRWLEEQKRSNRPPPCYGQVQLCPMLTSFSSYGDYHKVVNPLMLLTLWSKVSSDAESNKLQNRSQPSVIHLDSLEELGVNGRNKLMLLKCHVLLNINADSSQHHPYSGDLCQLDVCLEPSVAPIGDHSLVISDSQGAPVHCIRLFAYVVAISKEPYYASGPMWTNVNPTLRPTCKMNVTLKTKHKDCIRQSYKLRLRVLTNIRPELRVFEAVGRLANSTLCTMILNPVIRDYVLPTVNLNKGLVLQNSLTESQKKAVLQCAALCLRHEPKIGLIQGPPGTGKSMVIVNIIMQVLYGENNYQKTSRKSNRPRILLCAPSNAATDELVYRLLQIRKTLPKEDRFKMVRLGRVAAMRPSVREISLEDLSKRDVRLSLQECETLESVGVEINNLEAKLRSYEISRESAQSRNTSTTIYEKRINDIKRKLTQLKNRMHNKVDPSLQKKMERQSQLKLLAGADIIASTLTSCSISLMCEVFGESEGQARFTCCIVDEATQCCEPEILLPLSLGVSKFVLVGDPEQLQATVVSKEAHDHGFGQSLFTRIWNKFGCDCSSPVHFLNIQHRMHPEICKWPSQYFYGNKILTADTSKWICKLKPYIVFCLEFKQHSYNEVVNYKEALLVSDLAIAISTYMGHQMKISVITPYQRQRVEILRYLDKCSFSPDQPLDVSTIDSFQGQECDVAIISCARTDGVGFLTDSQRLNVALTRARHSLIICGNFVSLKKDGMWRDLLQNASDRGLLINLRYIDVPCKEELLRMVTDCS